MYTSALESEALVGDVKLIEEIKQLHTLQTEIIKKNQQCFSSDPVNIENIYLYPCVANS